MLACLEMIEKEEKRKARQARLNEIRAKKEGMEIGEKRGITIGEKTGEKRGEKRGEIRGEKRGIILGLKQGATQIAQKLLSKNFSVSEIIDITGLSKEEIEQLIQA